MSPSRSTTTAAVPPGAVNPITAGSEPSSGNDSAGETDKGTKPSDQFQTGPGSTDDFCQIFEMPTHPVELCANPLQVSTDPLDHIWIHPLIGHLTYPLPSSRLGWASRRTPTLTISVARDLALLARIVDRGRPQAVDRLLQLGQVGLVLPCPPVEEVLRVLSVPGRHGLVHQILDLRDDALNLLRLALQLPTQTLNNIDIHTQTCHVNSLSMFAATRNE